MENCNKEKNILILGDSNVGKTSLVDQYVVNKQSSISAGISFKSDVYVKKMFVNNCKLQMQVRLLGCGSINIFLIYFSNI